MSRDGKKNPKRVKAARKHWDNMTPKQLKEHGRKIRLGLALLKQRKRK